jgi:hypothetical protein
MLVEPLQAALLLPQLIRLPRDGVRRRILVRHAAGDEETVLACVHLVLVLQNGAAEREGEEELVLLEQGAADHAVQEVGEKLVKIVQPNLQLVTLVRVVDGVVEEHDVPREGVLVHGLDVAQLRDVEEQPGNMHCDGPVAFTRLVDLRLRLGGDGLLLAEL